MTEFVLEKSRVRSTERINNLIKEMESHSWTDRTEEWFKKDMFKDIGKENSEQSVIVRRSLAIKEILEAMTNKELFDGNNPHYQIRDGELIVGVITLGSLGLGKVFPNYLTQDELDVASVTTKSEMGLFGHNSVNYEEMLSGGLNKIIADCKNKTSEIENKIAHFELLLGYSDKIKSDHSFIEKIAKQNSSGQKSVIAESLKVVFEKQHKSSGKRTTAFDDSLKLLFEMMENHININQNDLIKSAKNKNEQNEFPYLKQINDLLIENKNILHNRLDFYSSVKTSCEAVISFAVKYADLADELINSEKDLKRISELKEISRICKKVPAQPADTFHEALQSIYFFHLALHSSMNQLSLGRLDQVINKYYKADEEGKQQEILECFLIKCAERLILDPDTFVKQDHVDYGSNLLTIPVPLDQWAESNEFLQNIIIGGQTREGENAVNECTYLILNAYKNTKLYTPTLNARIYNKHLDNSIESERYLNAISECLYETKNAMPVIGNDDVLIPAMNKYSEIPIDEARDYVIDGCWEPLLNGSCDWTFRMFNMQTALECALNGGATLSSNPILLRGQKTSYETPLPAVEKDIDFEGLLKIFKKHIKFFTDNAALSIHKLYVIDQAINPNPLFSALLDGCMENGRDKTWGGAKYKLAGIIPAGVPNAANTLAAIKKWVYDRDEFKLEDVLEAFRYSYLSESSKKQKTFNIIKKSFHTESPKFGNNDTASNEIMEWLVNTYYECVKESQALAEEVFLYPPQKEDLERITSLRALAGYSGQSLKEEFGEDFKINITAGMGTFELFDIFGGGNSASADREKAGEPLARNFAPMVGSTNYSVGHLLSSLKNLGLERFAGGVITDLCFDENELINYGPDIIKSVIKNFIENNGNMMSVTISEKTLLNKIYELCEKNNNGDLAAKKELKKYDRVSVRVGGFQMPFITLPPVMQLSYIDRPISPNGSK